MLIAESSRRDVFGTVKYVMKSESELAFNSISAVFSFKRQRYRIFAEPLSLKELNRQFIEGSIAI
jgi:hypothetical protein